MTPHSIVRSLLLLGWKVTATLKGAWDVTMIGAERQETKVEVILGVDTHLDFHVAVAVDHLGRRLGESSVPTTVKGYEGLLCWAEGFGPLRCAGVEGTSSYGAGLARHLKSQGIKVLEVERPERRRGGLRAPRVDDTARPSPASAPLVRRLRALGARAARILGAIGSTYRNDRFGHRSAGCRGRTSAPQMGRGGRTDACTRRPRLGRATPRGSAGGPP